jgi:hypothetical protein
MTRPTVLPNGMLHTEWALSAMDGLGLDPNMMLHAAVNLFAYVRGSAMNVEMELESEQDTGLTDDQWLESQGAQFARVLASAGYPQLARVIATTEVDLDLDTLFEFGLERLLDGYAALIERRGLPSAEVARSATAALAPSPAADASRPNAPWRISPGTKMTA